MFEKYEKAGKIASKVRKEAVKKITAGMKVIDLVEKLKVLVLDYLSHVMFLSIK